VKAKLQSLIRRAIPFIGIEAARGATAQSLTRMELDIHRREMREKTPENPALHGYKCYSQFDEDGIIAHISETLKIENGSFVEFGAGNGLENNTHLLLLKGWSGLWVDGSPGNAKYIRDNIPVHTNRLAFDSSFINRNNICEVIERGLKQIGREEFDLYNMDLDGNDVYLTDEVLTRWKPKIIVAEYNGKLPYGLRMTVDYDENGWRKGDDYFGASLSEHIARLNGYRLVCCGLSGVNAYFVRDDLADKFPEYDPALLYQPARAHLTLMSVGSRASLKFLAQTLRTP
jgi:hypothetical protein